MKQNRLFFPITVTERSAGRCITSPAHRVPQAVCSRDTLSSFVIVRRSLSSLETGHQLWKRIDYANPMSSIVSMLIVSMLIAVLFVFVYCCTDIIHEYTVLLPLYPFHPIRQCHSQVRVVRVVVSNVHILVSSRHPSLLSRNHRKPEATAGTSSSRERACKPARSPWVSPGGGGLYLWLVDCSRVWWVVGGCRDMRSIRLRPTSAVGGVRCGGLQLRW